MFCKNQQQQFAFGNTSYWFDWFYSISVHHLKPIQNRVNDLVTFFHNVVPTKHHDITESIFHQCQDLSQCTNNFNSINWICIKAKFLCNLQPPKNYPHVHLHESYLSHLKETSNILRKFYFQNSNPSHCEYC